MHRLIMGCREKVDHRDNDGLNNQRYNLRKSTDQQNCANRQKTRGSSQFKGVVRDRNAWQAYIKVNGVKKNLGRFKDEFDAAQAYNFAALEAFGEFARMNKP